MEVQDCLALEQKADPPRPANQGTARAGRSSGGKWKGGSGLHGWAAAGIKGFEKRATMAGSTVALKWELEMDAGGPFGGGAGADEEIADWGPLRVSFTESRLFLKHLNQKDVGVDWQDVLQKMMSGREGGPLGRNPNGARGIWALLPCRCPVMEVRQKQATA